MNISAAEPWSKDASTALSCYHCALPIAAGAVIVDETGESLRAFCCPGCQAITRLIEQGGLDRYYKFRDRPGTRPELDDMPDYQIYDDPAIHSCWMRNESGTMTLDLLAENIHCAACVWLIERWLARIDGVLDCSVSLGSYRVGITLDSSKLKPGELFETLHQIGYPARPYTQQNRQRVLGAKRQALLNRLGVSAAFGMQIMVISVALYAGDWFGIEPDIAQFMQRVNLLLCLPILGYGASPFFHNAWQKLRHRRIGMDTPVSIALILAFAGSVWALGSGKGETYFDSIAMFVVLLTGARLLEVNARLRAAEPLNDLVDVVPDHALRLVADERRDVVTAIAVAEIRASDLLLVKSDAAVPVDGTLVSEMGSFDESLLTGEHLPVNRKRGDAVLAGSVNIDHAVRIRASSDPQDSVLQSVLTMADQAAETRPWLESLAERIAGWFVAAVLIMTALVAAYGLQTGSGDWLGTSIAVLVVTCPCALSLATPLAMTAAANTLLGQGLFVVNRRAIDTLARIDTLFLDKTGTVTTGRMSVTDIQSFQTNSGVDPLILAAALEQYATHPIAKAIVRAADTPKLPSAHDIQQFPGLGISGRIGTQNIHVGSLEFMQQALGESLDSETLLVANRFLENLDDIAVFVGVDNQLLGGIVFSDPLRAEAAQLVNYLETENISVAMLSGDRSKAVAAVARRTGIHDYQGECLPEHKLLRLQTALDQGKLVAMAGDGVNDTPALSRAHLGIAIAPEFNVAATNADIVMTGNDLGSLISGMRIARKTRGIVRQNIIWALCYNALAVPAAVAGLVPPWLAGIGMSLSSIVVVINASRLNRPVPRKTG